jgi:hypothetical protein
MERIAPTDIQAFINLFKESHYKTEEIEDGLFAFHHGIVHCDTFNQTKLIKDKELINHNDQPTIAELAIETLHYAYREQEQLPAPHSLRAAAQVSHRNLQQEETNLHLGIASQCIRLTAEINRIKNTGASTPKYQQKIRPFVFRIPANTDMERQGYLYGFFDKHNNPGGYSKIIWMDDRELHRAGDILQMMRSLTSEDIAKHISE